MKVENSAHLRAESGSRWQDSAEAQLRRVVREQKGQIEAQGKRISELEHQVLELKRKVTALERRLSADLRRAG